MSSGSRSVLGRRTVVLVAVTALLLASVATPVGSAGATGDGTAAVQSTEATLTVDIERNGSTLRYTATVRAPAAADRLRLDGAFGVLNVSRTDGFVAEGNGYRLRDGRERATLTASIDLDEPRATPLGAVGPNGPFQAGENWAFAPSPRYHVRWWSEGKIHSTTIHDAREQTGATESVVRADAPVAVGERFVFLGPHEIETTQVEGRTVRVVVPDAASFGVGADRSVRLARQVHRAAGVTPERQVTAFVLPRAVRGGGAASGADLWVRADAGELTVAHEFAHTALTLPTTAETRWLSEAAAEYLAYRATHETGVTETLRERVTDVDAVLADRSTWESEQVAYRKGAALLALLDQRIRTATDGQQSLTTVLGQLSQTEGRIGAADLGGAVASVADDRTASWLEEQTTGTAPATLPEKRASGLVATDGLDRLLLTGQGVDSFGDLVALITALGAFSVLCWVPLRLAHRLYRRLAARLLAT